MSAYSESSADKKRDDVPLGPHYAENQAEELPRPASDTTMRQTARLWISVMFLKPISSIAFIVLSDSFKSVNAWGSDPAVIGSDRLSPLGRSDSLRLAGASSVASFSSSSSWSTSSSASSSASSLVS